MTVSLGDLLPDAQWDPSSDVLLNRFLDYVNGRKLTLYPAQEEAVLELLDGKNVILNTPTGSGKSLVASAMLFKALARGQKAVYTCPIKALVNEKWMALCRDFGPDLVGLSTGDATVNRNAPILCCTAEVLANIALREGADAPISDVVMDEFHYYADRDRGVAWQVPLLTMRHTRFLLMSATLGETRTFEEAITRLNGYPTVTIRSGTRPVPLDYAYSEIPLSHTIEKLVDEGKTPAYVVHFTQADAASSAQDFTSLKICTKEQKAEIAARIAGFQFSSPYGADIRKWLRHGIGLHHAGLLPKYRVLVEQLAQAGLLKVICGTDTLGAGINVPIRTVLFTRLCKFDGQKTAHLSARDFHQIAGRAGRKGFDDQGYVVVQAPEHVIENLRLAEKSARDGKKITKRKPPDRNFVNWDLDTFKRLINAKPEPLVSRFQVTHGMLLNVLSRDSDGCRAMQQLIRDSHEPLAVKPVLRKRGWQLFRSLVARGVVELIPMNERSSGAKVRVNVDLQDDFSMDQTLSLYLLETLPLLDADSETYALDVLALVESILENPEIILRKQLDRIKDRAVAQMKADGVEYDQRMEELEKLEYPKPLRDFIYDTFNAFADKHPWVGAENIRPKSIAREMFEQFQSFAEYVLTYDLERSEGLLLRHLHSVYKVLSQTVPDGVKTDEVREMELYLRTLLRQVDSSLEDEWERMRDPAYLPPGAPRPGESLRPPGAEDAANDITRDRKAFIAAVRTHVFTFLRAWSIGDHAGALEALALAAGPVESPVAWTVDQLKSARERYRVEHVGPRFDPEGRNLRHTHVTETDRHRWRVQQVLVDHGGAHGGDDAEAHGGYATGNDDPGTSGGRGGQADADAAADGGGHNDWIAEFLVDLDASRAAQAPVLTLVSLAPIA